MRITTEDAADGRFARFGLIGWWDQRRLGSARVLVVGAGALGNELLKNLALLGVGHVTVVDGDRIEHSNLSRSVLYRAGDAGRYKADVAAERAVELYPEMRVTPIVGDVRCDVGLGHFRAADVVLGGLDNREARLFINRACYRFGVPFVDGAIESLDGSARTFVPPGPCYECTMSERDWDLLRHRRSCNGLAPADMQGGKTPTTPTAASIVAAVQVQETLKLLHGQEVPAGRAWSYNGHATDAFATSFQRNPDCMSHDPLGDVLRIPGKSDEATFGDVLAFARRELGDDVRTLELPRPVLARFECRNCGKREEVLDLLDRVTGERLPCPDCGAARDVIRLDGVDEASGLLDKAPRAVGLPTWDVLVARTADGPVGLEFADDLPSEDADDADAGGLEFDA